MFQSKPGEFEAKNQIWRRIRGWEHEIDRISLGDFEDPREAIRQLAEFVGLLAEEVGELITKWRL